MLSSRLLSHTLSNHSRISMSFPCHLLHLQRRHTATGNVSFSSTYTQSEQVSVLQALETAPVVTSISRRVALFYTKLPSPPIVVAQVFFCHQDTTSRYYLIMLFPFKNRGRSPVHQFEVSMCKRECASTFLAKPCISLAGAGLGKARGIEDKTAKIRTPKRFPRQQFPFHEVLRRKWIHLRYRHD